LMVKLIAQNYTSSMGTREETGMERIYAG